MFYAITAVIALVIGAAAGYFYRKGAIEKKIGQSEETAMKLVEDATHKAEDRKKEILLEAKEEVIRQERMAFSFVHQTTTEKVCEE